MATLPPVPINGQLPNPWNEPSERAAYAIEAAQLTQRFMDHFWHEDISMFKATELSAEAGQAQARSTAVINFGLR
jgi:hypothetical protein